MRNHRWRRIAVVTAVAALVAVPTVPSQAAPPPALQTPSFSPAGFDLSTTSYTLQFEGAGRRQTAGAMAVTASNTGGADDAFPFDQGDKTAVDEAYGFGTCPKAVGIAADDAPADSMSASSAFNMMLVGVTIASGGSKGTPGNVDTTDGVLLLTQSARTGATDLSPEVLQAIQKIRDAGCAAFDSVVFGGPAAVPPTAITTLDTVTNTVFEFAGDNRQDTSRKVARAVIAGMGGLPTVTHHPVADPTGDSDVVLENAVFLVEAQTGADGLAIGSFAAVNHVPVLITDTMPLHSVTSEAMTEFQPENIIVLGRDAAIHPTTAAAASTAAGGATITTIGGAARADTSVDISKQLFNIWPEFAVDAGSGDANGFYSRRAFGFARSEGRGADHVGWPDVLSSAWWLGLYALHGENPSREAPPVEKNGPGTTKLSGDDAPMPVPMLLTGQAGLPSVVATYVSSLYPDPENMHTATQTDGDLDDGGFGFVFGGDAAVAHTQTLDIAQRLSGGTYVAANRSDLAPTMTDGRVFYTNLDFSAYTPGNPTTGGPHGETAAGDKVCAFRNALTGTEWLTTYKDGNFRAQSLVAYETDGNGFPPFQSLFTCVSAGSQTAVKAIGFSPSGHETPSKDLNWAAAASRLRSTAPGSDSTANGGTTADPTGCSVFGDQVATASCINSWIYTGDLPVTFKDTSHGTATFTLRLSVTRTDGPTTGDDADSITATGTLTVVDGDDPLFTATLTGESSTAGAFFFCSLAISGFYSQSGALGGFHLTVAQNAGLCGINPSGNPLTDLALQGNAA